MIAKKAKKTDIALLLQYSILSLGARFLLKLPDLHTFQLYNPLFSYAYPPAPTLSTATRPPFIPAYSNQPASTNFEDLAFPPSPVLHVSHRLTRTQPTAAQRRFVYVNTPPTAPQPQSQLHAFLTQSTSPPLASSVSKVPPGNLVAPPSIGNTSTLGPQAGPTSEVVGYLAAWRKHCKKLRRVQFVKDYMWKRLGEDMPWTGVVVDEENAIRFA